MDRIRLIASDMDATLLDEHSQLPPRFEQTVCALAQEGILFAAASGRPIYTLERMFLPLLDKMVLIGDNGGAVRWKGETLFVSEMAPAGWRALARFAKDAGEVGVLCGLDCAYLERSQQKYDSVMKKFYTSIQYVDDLEHVDAPVDKFSIYLPEGNAQAVYDGRYAPAFAAQYSVAVAGCNWLDVMNPGVHKGAALAEVGRHLGIPPAAMMAFGDTFNDEQMLHTARYGFLMENGSPALRRTVPFLAPPNTQHGVMQILDFVLARQGLVDEKDFVRADAKSE